MNIEFIDSIKKCSENTINERRLNNCNTENEILNDLENITMTWEEKINEEHKKNM